MKATKERRIGKFSIPTRFVNDAPEAAVAVLRGLFIVRAECIEYKGSIDYVAYGDQFQPTDALSEPPTYTLRIRDLIGGKYHVEWEKV